MPQKLKFLEPKGTAPLSSPQYSPYSPPYSARFRHSIHQIPTPGEEAIRPKRYEPWIINLWVVGGVTGVMFALAVTLEIMLYFSNRDNGFYVPPNNPFKFASTQFLSSFFPTLLVAPLAFYWTVADSMVRWYQPYIILSGGNASATNSILLDYVSRLMILWTAFKHRHWLIYASTLLSSIVVFLQPLAGSVFTVKQVPHSVPVNATSIRQIGLLWDLPQLYAYVSSSGYADAAVYNNLTDPPFVHGGWTAAEFAWSSYEVINATLTVNTTGVETSVNCMPATSVSLDSPSSGLSTLTASMDGCSGPTAVSFNASNASNQYGSVNASACVSSGEALDINFQPIMFWWYYPYQPSPLTAAVFCHPTMEFHNIQAVRDLNDGSLQSVQILSPYSGSDNVTGAPLYGRPWNGVVFDPSDDAIVNARATSIGTGIPGTVFRYGIQLNDGVVSLFQGANGGFANVTTGIYTQHLALAAKATYFIKEPTTVPGQLTSFVSRLFIESFASHTLVAFLLAIGFIGLWLHWMHARARSQLHLTAPPGSIAATAALTSRSGFGELLVPYDDEKRMEEKLTGLRFGIDDRTGAIVAVESDIALDYQLHGQIPEGITLLGRHSPPMSGEMGIGLTPSTSPMYGSFRKAQEAT
ncbi:hypothetical protein CONPUDRAFT_139032 [Coniophora puteana RWD-64-598 SS2]|uniref:Uncharacterized protein n=1 Tax=Coniophora puteana (strain RWD-64-598) TaxID=741705 RepID=A0A5M3MFG7_CONPW|nr:uncharacterized protein CONPUDRAFT_139032 [Coniophora puteana RWD-64-598 SS2]EIW77903.1 hypothetical protein CONPUDRAFT_139032 [Coniophora puteana RWD-64-598 SS2]